MSSMYGIQTQPESMAHIHGVCDPHMNSLSLQVRDIHCEGIWVYLK